MNLKLRKLKWTLNYASWNDLDISVCLYYTLVWLFSYGAIISGLTGLFLAFMLTWLCMHHLNFYCSLSLHSVGYISTTEIGPTFWKWLLKFIDFMVNDLLLLVGSHWDLCENEHIVLNCLFRIFLGHMPKIQGRWLSYCAKVSLMAIYP